MIASTTYLESHGVMISILALTKQKNYLNLAMKGISKKPKFSPKFYATKPICGAIFPMLIVCVLPFNDSWHARGKHKHKQKVARANHVLHPLRIASFPVLPRDSNTINCIGRD